MVLICSILIAVVYCVSVGYAMDQLGTKGCKGEYFIEWAIVLCPILNTILACIYLKNWVKANGIMSTTFRELFK